MSNRFQVYTVDALELVHSSNADLKKKGQNKYTLTISFPSGQEGDKTILSIPSSVTEESREDCALFHQILCLSSDSPDNPNALKDKIIVVRFNDLFGQVNPKQDNIAEVLKGDRESSSDWINHISNLLDPDIGITITFKSNKNKQTVRFVPFDKSSSMAKRHRITFISEEIKDRLDERLRLGMDFRTIPVSLSKYYAYRGLYLTSGTRIEQTADFVLNEKTVLVLPDLKLHPTDDYAGIPKVYTQKGIRTEENPLYQFETREEIIESNAFDGEGLISPEYADCIRSQLKNKANSFQVRMPFIKGMLHQVSFHKFISDEGHVDANGDLLLKDFLGKERSIKDAQIIINESMFKCHSWLKYYWDNNKDIDKKKYNNDPMKFFFDRMNHYEHSVYISGSNASFESSGLEKLNYQFLMTMKLSHDDIKKLIDEHFKNSENELRNYLHPDDIYSKKVKSYIAAATLNPAFYSEQRLIADAIQQVKNMRIDCGLGALLTEGEHRYLSADLLAYLWYIINLATQPEGFDHDDFFKNENVLHSRFYMPESKTIDPENPDKYYALERSPHLSRNEECLMKAHIPDNKKDLYYKYFKHLTGIIMIPVTSLAALVCGGADYDGDLLKIYSNKTITCAVEKGGYKDDKRFLPVVNIPTAKAPEEFPTDSSRFKLLIANTFSNYTGLISNMSVTFASRDYRFSAGKKAAENSLCPKATAIVGLSIDAAKNGGHPMENIKEMMEASKTYNDEEAEKPGEDYIRFKDAMLEIRGINYKRVAKNSEKKKYILSLPITKHKLVIKEPQKTSHSILELPATFAALDYEANDKEYLINNKFLPDTNGISGSDFKFTFESNEGEYLHNLRREGKAQTEDLIREYLQINQDIRNFNLYLAKKTNSYGKLISLLNLKYDSLDDPIPSTGTEENDETILETLDTAIDIIQNLIDSPAKANLAIKQLSDCNWLFCKKGKRAKELCKIIGLEDEYELPPQVINLLTDFSFDGYFILYYIIEVIYSVLRENRTLSERLEQWFLRKRSDSKVYYNDLLNVYRSYSHITISDDQHSSENGDPVDVNLDDESRNQNDAFRTWKDQINCRTYELLQEIAKGNDLLALEYAHNARSTVDKRGTFFWDVLPKKLILEYVKVRG